MMAMMPKIVMPFGSGAFYEDLAGRRWSLSSLTPRERRFLRSFVKRVNEGVSWPDLCGSWRVTLLKLCHGRSRKDVVRLPLYAVCQDIESRVGIDQGFFRQRDWIVTSAYPASLPRRQGLDPRPHPIGAAASRCESGLGM